MHLVSYLFSLHLPGKTVVKGVVYVTLIKNDLTRGEFPSGLVVRTLHFHCQGQVLSLVGGRVGVLRSCKLHGAAKKECSGKDVLFSHKSS